MSTEGTVLLVEDDEHDVFFMQRAFARAGIDNPLVSVSDGQEAIWYLKGEGGYADRTRHPLPQLMLLDLKLPSAHGFDVLSWIRQQPGPLGRLPVVVLTSSSLQADEQKAQDLGANEYVLKPFSTEGLAALLQGLSRRFPVLAGPPPA